MTLLDAVVTHLHTDTSRWPDRHGDYHADCPYCGKPAKKAQTHFVISKDGLCYCQVCQQGTTLSALAKHLGLTMTPAANGVQPQVTYDYRDAAGALAYQVVRYSKQGKKAFYQRRPDGNGGWINKLEGVGRVLYQLPEVAAAVDRNDPIFIVEGEKDVEALRLRGLVATTNVGGAGKWQSGYGEVLRGATVYILPDNDAPGVEHAQTIKTALRGIVQSARIVRLPDLPDKGDVSDWLEAGHTIEELRSLIAGQALVSAKEAPNALDVTPEPLAPYSGDDLMAMDIPAPRQFVQGLLREGLAFFIGQPGVGKTPALIQLAIAFATGGLWFGVFRVPKIRVAYIGPEYDKGDVRSIIMASTGGQASLPNLLIFTVENFRAPNSEEEAIALVEKLITVFKAEAIIIDLFPGFLPPEKFKQNAYRGDYREFLAYHRTVLAHHVLLVGAWHGTKRDANPATMYNGGQGFWGAAGGGRLVMFQDEEDQVKLYSQLRGNKAITYAVTESHADGIHTWAVLDGIEPEPALGSDVHRAIYRTIKEHAPTQGLTPKIIAGLVKPELTTNVSEAYIRKCIAVLTKRGILKAVGDAYVIARGSQGSRGSEVYEDREDREVYSDPSDPSPIPQRDRGSVASVRDKSRSDPSDPSLLPIPEENALSKGVIDRLKHRGTPRVLRGEELDNALTRDNPDTYLTPLPELPEEEDNATEG